MGASVDCSAAINDRAAVERLLGAGLTRVASRMEAATDWYQRATSIAREFAGCRLTRERAINGRTGGATDIVQAGLFDRRAERQRLADRAVASEDAADRDRRIRILEQSSRITNIAPELILVLAP
jgi:hypothetical protein